jgi:hypothetical protein
VGHRQTQPRLTVQTPNNDNPPPRKRITRRRCWRIAAWVVLVALVPSVPEQMEMLRHLPRENPICLDTPIC